MEQRLDAAAGAGDIDALYSLMKEDAYLLERIEEVPFIDTPLHIAASAGQVHFAMEIMRLKPSFARKLNQNGYSPTHLALQNEQTKLVLRLLDVDRELVRVKGREGKTPLHFAAECGMIDLLAEFLSVCPKSIEDLTIRKESALHVAVKSDKLEALEVLMEWLEHVGMNRLVLNWCDDEENTILHVAASRNQTEVVKLLIARGVDVNAINMVGITALDISKQPNESGNLEIRESLIQARALEAASLPRINFSLRYLRRDERLEDAAIKDAAKAGDTSALYSLIQEDPYILKCFDDIPCVETPLHIAARLGHFKFAMEIMRWKPSFARKPNQQGLCPIHLAVIGRHIQTLKDLLSFDTGLVHLQGREGKTSLHYAAEKGDILLLETLLSACPLSILDVTDQGDTALHVAIKNSKFGACNFLLRKLRIASHEGCIEQEKTVLNSQDQKGNTVVQRLLDSAVEVNAKNAEGKTALGVLEDNQGLQSNTKIKKTLRKAEASSISSKEDNRESKLSKMERVVISIIRYKRDMSTESRNLLLIVFVLIATITYQSAVNPPKRDYDKMISCNQSCSNNFSAVNPPKRDYDKTISCNQSCSNNFNISCSIKNTSDASFIVSTSLFCTYHYVALCCATWLRLESLVPGCGLRSQFA
ncbi:hypothetical protein TIFTF001_003030 [Ficus carica]|uniref:Uncharacterized protein n=1 Tax=Ficus carica TaxID=3494 RepID=A0AA87Z679_FICCA|nr:hypothetical protein TIFTF001_003030 [Ficus carica]